jgi:hypothetical protein
MADWVAYPVTILMFNSMAQPQLIFFAAGV